MIGLINGLFLFSIHKHISIYEALELRNADYEYLRKGVISFDILYHNLH